MTRHRLSVWRRRSNSILVGATVAMGMIAAITPLFLTSSVSALETMPPVAPQLTGENFNTHSGEDYKGINVGFRAEGFRDVTAVTVSLYQDDTLLVANTENDRLLALINGGETRLSTPFIIIGGTYVEEYWKLGSYAWAHDTRPNRAIISITTTTDATPATTTTTITGLSEATASLANMLPAPPATTAPGVAIDTTSLTGPTPTIRGTVDSDAVNVQISLDGGTTWQAATYAAGETTWAYIVSEPLANGTYTVLARASDAAGNVTTPPTAADFTVATPPEDEDDEDSENGGRGDGTGTNTPQVLELTPVEEPPAPSITLFSSSLPRERKPATTNTAPSNDDEARVQAVSTTNTDRGNVEKEIITTTQSSFNWYWIILVLAILAAGYYGYRNWRLNKTNRS